MHRQRPIRISLQSFLQSAGRVVAVKKIPLSGGKESNLADVLDEVQTLNVLAHPNIVKYFGIFSEAKQFTSF
ncbi:hypothetical protein BC829DRAFT_152652 [Chytridium lagenaria]|nr:hypothetical protein BC829DRAFT_152652 [Chytridium lagenaria]